MLKDLIRRSAAGLIGAAALAAAAAAVVVAASFACYAALKVYVPQAGAAGLTAVAFAVVAALIGWVTAKLAGGGAAKDRDARRRRTASPAVEIGMALAGLATDMVAARRAGAKGKDRRGQSRSGWRGR